MQQAFFLGVGGLHSPGKKTFGRNWPTGEFKSLNFSLSSEIPWKNKTAIARKSVLPKAAKLA
jgi:hypothetical protein